MCGSTVVVVGRSLIPLQSKRMRVRARVMGIVPKIPMKMQRIAGLSKK
jgi:hypothetical protein